MNIAKTHFLGAVYKELEKLDFIKWSGFIDRFDEDQKVTVFGMIPTDGGDKLLAVEFKVVKVSFDSQTKKFMVEFKHSFIAQDFGVGKFLVYGAGIPASKITAMEQMKDMKLEAMKTN